MRGRRLDDESWRGDVACWLRTFLGMFLRGWSSEVFETSNYTQATFLKARRLFKAFPMLETFDIRVDVTGILQRKDRVKLALVECKTDPISLKHVGPLLAYSRLTSPVFALLVSPNGLSPHLRSILRNHERTYLLEYFDQGHMKIAKWDLSRKRIDFPSVIPRGQLL